MIITVISNCHLSNQVAKAAQAKEKRGKKAASSAVKEEPEEKDEFDMMVDNKDANRKVESMCDKFSHQYPIVYLLKL